MLPEKNTRWYFFVWGRWCCESDAAEGGDAQSNVANVMGGKQKKKVEFERVSLNLRVSV